MRAAAARVLPPIGLIVVPVVAYVNLLLLARGNDTLAQDFHNEIYPEAQELLHRHEQFFRRRRSPRSRITSGRRSSATSRRR